MPPLIGGYVSLDQLPAGGLREPSLNVLLAYARAISNTGRGEFLEAIIDDEMDLPRKMPADPKKAAARKK
jgi:hypothetical protein